MRALKSSHPKLRFGVTARERTGLTPKEDVRCLVSVMAPVQRSELGGTVNDLVTSVVSLPLSETLKSFELAAAVDGAVRRAAVASARVTRRAERMGCIRPVSNRS